MTLFFDISCPHCGPFHAQSERFINTCPECKSKQAIVMEHSQAIDNRLRREKDALRRGHEEAVENMLGRMDIDV